MMISSPRLGQGPSSKETTPRTATLRRTTLVAVFFVLAALQTRMSPVGQEFHDLPSWILPFGLILGVITLGLYLVDNPPSGEIPGPATTLVLLFMLLLVGIRLPGLITTDDRELAIENLIFYVKDAAIVVAVVFAMERVDGIRTALAGFVTAGTLVAGLGIHKMITGNTGNYWGFARSAEGLVSADENGTRLSGPFEDPNYYAQSLIVVLGVSIGCMVGTGSARLRLAAAASAIVCLVAVGFSLSRGGMLAIVVMTAVVLLRRYRLRVVASVAVGVVVLGLLLPLPVVGRLTSVAEAPASVLGQDQAEDPSVSGRTSEMLAAVAMFIDHPILGVGTGNYDTNYLEYSTGIGLDPRRTERAAHNLFLEAAAELGIVGIMGFALFVGAAVAVPGRIRTKLVGAGRGEDAALAEGLQLAVIGYLVTAVFLHDAFSRLFVLVAALGLAAVLLDPARRRSSPPQPSPSPKSPSPRSLSTPIEAGVVTV